MRALQVVTSSTMAMTKEGGELKAANLPNWRVLEEPGDLQKHLRSSSVSFAPSISFLILVAFFSYPSF